MRSAQNLKNRLFYVRRDTETKADRAMTTQWVWRQGCQYSCRSHEYQSPGYRKRFERIPNLELSSATTCWSLTTKTASGASPRSFLMARCLCRRQSVPSTMGNLFSRASRHIEPSMKGSHCFVPATITPGLTARPQGLRCQKYPRRCSLMV